MGKKCILPPKPKRSIANFLEGKIVHWFDGVSDNKNTKLISLTILSTGVDEKGRLIICSAPTDNLPETSPQISQFYVEQNQINWSHLADSKGVRIFAFSNPFFLTEEEVFWLSKAGKSKEYRDLLIGFMSEVDIRGSDLSQFGIAMHNWMQFWRSHRIQK